jgi:hypothetical protein
VKWVAIERKAGIAPDVFVRDHLHGSGMPVIVTDATEYWPALHKWTFERFKIEYGSDLVVAPYGLGSETAKLTKIGPYIDYLEHPESDLAGFWVDGKCGKPLPDGPGSTLSPAYLLGWDAFRKHPELFNDIQPPPYFVSDWVLAMNPSIREVFEQTSGREYWSIYAGPEGALSPLHVDYWQTHAYLAQVRGRKRVIMFSPEDSQFLYKGEVDPEQPDFEKFELFEQAIAYECEIGPGEMLFMPANWWHHVRTIEKSITVSHNFFNDTNFNEHLAGLMGNMSALAESVRRPQELKSG